MKKIFLIISVLALFSTLNAQKYYAYITDLEHDKTLEGDGETGLVDITTNIVSFDCEAGPSTIEYQYLLHYAAEEKTESRGRYLVDSDHSHAWIYNTYDEAVASRRDWMAKIDSKHKRRIENFFVTCE